MSENMIKKIEASLENVEKQIEAGEKVSLKEINSLQNRIKNLANLCNLSEEDMKKYQDRIDVVKKHIESNKKEFILIPAESKEKIKSNAPKYAVGLAALGIVIALGITACNNSKNNANQVIETELSTEDDKVENVETMDAEYKEISDDIVLSMNDAISKGLVVNEENKETMVKKYVLYYLLNQMDTLTDEQWANIFQNSNITAEDIINAKYDMEWIDEQRVTASSSDMMLDYSLIFENESDAKLLNDANILINNIKTTSGDERKVAISIFKQYINDNLALNNGRMNYSQRALDTFRKVHFDAFDTLTNGKEIDDELEHAINTTITCTLADSDLNVEDETIDSLQSKYTTYLVEKLETRLQTGWNYKLKNEVNPDNDVNKIVEYVSANIDLSLYKEMPNYEETLNNMFLTEGAQKSKDDSGVSDGEGGNISEDDMKDHGVDPDDPNAKEEYEDAVEEEDEKKSEEEKEYEDIEGEEVEDPELLAYYTQLGASDYYAGIYNESKVPAQYLNSYRNGMEIAKAAEEEAKRKAEEEAEEYFEPVESGATTYSEEETVDYTPISTNDYINQLEQLKQELLASTVELTEEENTKTI